jgi:hypothetical protein
MELAHLRKVYTLIATGAVMLILTRLNMTPADLIVYGVSLNEIQEALVELLMQIGIPAAFVAAQPNALGDTIWRHWRWIACGVAIVAVLLMLVVLPSWIF